MKTNTYMVEKFQKYNMVKNKYSKKNFKSKLIHFTYNDSS